MNYNDFIEYMKKKSKISSEEINKDLNNSLYKTSILFKYNVLRKIYFKNVYIKLNLVKKNKFQNYIEYKDLIYEYNTIIKDFNNFLYNFKYSTFTLENINNESNILIPQTEIYPYKIISYFYNSDEVKKKNLLNNSEAENYKINGLICFLTFKKTKIKEEIKLFIICDEEHKKDLYVVNILDFINKKHLDLYNEINKIIKKYLYYKWLEYAKYCKENYKKPEEENFMTNIYTGFLCTLSVSKENISKRDILEYLYCNNTNDYNDIHLHLYFELYQYGKQTNKFNVKKINKDINDFIIKNNMFHISHKLTKLDNNNFNFGVGFLNLDENQNICFLNYNNVNIFVFENSQSLETLYERLKKKNFITFNNSKIILKINNCNVETNLSNILFSNFLNFNKRYNFNKLYLYENNIYIPDIFIKYKNDIEKNIFYKELKKNYFIKKYDITIKKNINICLEKLFNIDNNDIDWLDFINSDKSIDLANINLNNFYKWFESTYKKYNQKKNKNALFIKNFFTCTNLDIIFFKSLFINEENNKYLKNLNNYNILKDFLKFFDKYYKIENNIIILKNNQDLNENKNFNFLFFVEILKIRFFLNIIH